MDIEANFEIARINSEPATPTVLKTLNQEVKTVLETTKDLIEAEVTDCKHKPIHSIKTFSFN